jgi:hypothetical protein
MESHVIPDRRPLPPQNRVPRPEVRGDEAAPQSAENPPAAVYVPACGVLCDIFWWARGASAAKQERQR